jgi:hypothetical protein
VVKATFIPLQDSRILAEMSYCIAIRVPKGFVEDCLIYDTDDPYKYVHLTACDDNNGYLIIGGCAHRVGQEDSLNRFKILAT